MDRAAARLANHIKRTVVGPMWHGGALGQVLEGVTNDQAAARQARSPADCGKSLFMSSRGPR